MVNTNWNLSDIYKTNEEFVNDLKLSKKLIKNLEKFKNKLNKNDKATILEYFKQDSECSIILEKLAVYARVKIDDNGKDEVALKNYAEINQLFSQMGESLAFVKTELSSLSDEFLNSLLADVDFEDYSREIEQIIREKKYTLSKEKEAIIARVSNFSDSDDVYSTLTDIEMNHGEFKDEKGEVHKLTTGNFNLFMKSPSASERKSVYEAYLKEYKNLNLTLSNLYVSHIKYMNFIAQIHGYGSVKDMLSYGEEVSSDIQMTNIKEVSAKKALLQEYFKLKKKILKLDEFYVSDIFADISTEKKEQISYEDAVNDIANAFKVLGADYVDMFKRAIKDGWIDAFPRDNKASGGYTIHTYSLHPYILLNFDGTQYWKSAIAHEFGHAMHSYYSAKVQPYAKSSYTIFVAEVASLTNEILLAHYELKNSKDKAQKVQILSEFLQLFYLNVYNSSLLAEFEIFAHDKLQNGEVLSASDMNQEFLKISEKYLGESVKFNENYEYDWSRKSHIFRDFYLYKYSTGLISACVIATKILNDKTGEYLKKYKEFLSLGGSKDPVSSLLVADVDILSPKTYELAFKMFEEFLNNLKNLTE